MARKSQGFVHIENHTSLVRDMSNQAVLNTDTEGQSRYRSLYAKRVSEIKEHGDTKKRLLDIEGELASIKTLIAELTHLTSSHTKIA
jgi:ABC-type sulfate transport system substrate-binding protein